MKLFSSGEVADMLGIHRDKVNSAIKSGAPCPEQKIGNYKGFTENDVLEFYAWCKNKNIKVKKPRFDLQPTA